MLNQATLDHLKKRVNVPETATAVCVRAGKYGIDVHFSNGGCGSYGIFNISSKTGVISKRVGKKLKGNY